ncbi:MAG: NAD-dependent epimerase/dehydratase family protein [Nitrososphaerales archaeon]
MNQDMESSFFAGKSFLVTGGAGFIGSHIAEQLLGLGASVTIVDDFSNGGIEKLPFKSDSLKIHQGDVRSFDYNSLGKVDGIFHEAARALIPSFKYPVTDLEVNTGGTIRILEYARKHGVKVVYASSGSVYGNPIEIPITEKHPLNPISPYAASKMASEIYCGMYYREYHLNVTMLRYFNVYGPRQSVSEEMGVIPIFVKRSLEKKPLRIFGDGKQTRDFLNVMDVVNANLLAYKSEKAVGQFINIGGGGNEISILDLARLVMDLCNLHQEPVFTDPKPGDIRRLVADNSRAEGLIGYIPSISLKDGLSKYIEFAKTSG